MSQIEILLRALSDWKTSADGIYAKQNTFKTF